jgi:hypothetical protein
LQRLLAALWAGQLLAVALLAAPNAFATLERPEAGAYVARLFQLDARLSMALGVLLMLLEQRRQRNAHPGRLRFGVALVLPLMALLLTLGAQEVLRPLMDTARGGPDFGWLHGLSMGAFAAKTLCVLLLAWDHFFVLACLGFARLTSPPALMRWLPSNLMVFTWGRWFLFLEALTSLTRRGPGLASSGLAEAFSGIGRHSTKSLPMC